MKISKFISSSEGETLAFAEELGKKAVPGCVYCLDGDLGAGKTVFARGFAKGLGIEEPVTSPTFTIVREYEGGRLPLYHFDVYRISDPEEMFEIGFEEYPDKGGVCLIEWAELIEELIPANAVHIRICAPDPTRPGEREIEIREPQAPEEREMEFDDSQAPEEREIEIREPQAPEEREIEI